MGNNFICHASTTNITQWHIHQLLVIPNSNKKATHNNKIEKNTQKNNIAIKWLVMNMNRSKIKRNEI